MGLSVGVGAGPVRYSKSIRMGSGKGLTGYLVNLFVVMFKLGFLLLWWMGVALWWLVVVLPVRVGRVVAREVRARRQP